jgi:hypothetical protein
VVYTPSTNQTVKVRVTQASGEALLRTNLSFITVTQIGVSAGATSFTNLTVTGNTTSGNILTSGNVTAAGNVAANFFIGNGSQLTGTGVPNWIAAGTIQAVGFGTTTTTPTLATSPEKNQVYYRQIGPKTWQVSVVYWQNNTTGVTLGTGEYWFRLPGGLQFDTTIQTQTPYAFLGATGPILCAFSIPGSTFAGSLSTTFSTSSIVPFAAEFYRVIGTVSGGDTRFIGSNWCQPNTAPFAWTWSFTFQSV